MIDVRASQCNAYIIVIQVLCVSYQRNNIFTFSFSNNWTRYSAMWCALWLITVVKYPIDLILLQVSCVRCCSMASSSALFTAGHDVHCGSFITIANYTRFNSSSSVMRQVPQDGFILSLIYSWTWWKNLPHRDVHHTSCITESQQICFNCQVSLSHSQPHFQLDMLKDSSMWCVSCSKKHRIANYPRFNSSSSVMCQVPQERFIDAVCFHICKPQTMCQIQVSCVRGHMKRLASSSVSLTTGHDETSSHALS